MSDFEKQCQSCGMPLEEGANSGTEANGEKSKQYCCLCYDKGAFLGPDATVEDMKKMANEGMKKKGFNFIFRWLALMQIPTLKRWRK